MHLEPAFLEDLFYQIDFGCCIFQFQGIQSCESFGSRDYPLVSPLYPVPSRVLGIEWGLRACFMNKWMCLSLHLTMHIMSLIFKSLISSKNKNQKFNVKVIMLDTGIHPEVWRTYGKSHCKKNNHKYNKK